MNIPRKYANWHAHELWGLPLRGFPASYTGACIRGDRSYVDVRVLFRPETKCFGWGWREVYGCELTPEQERERYERRHEEQRQLMIEQLKRRYCVNEEGLEQWTWEKLDKEIWRCIYEEIRRERRDPVTGKYIGDRPDELVFPA